ncbi:hypothetical protein [Terrihabitans sp. B22-R8]|uniref:hypothetical protein n=1 Tax=Terrihabitans sp. B22-R8 TaxID=3425128 RepID=UPI00403D48CD
MTSLTSLLTEGEKKIVENHTDASGRRHPAWTALNAHDLARDYDRSPKDYLVNSAIEAIGRHKHGSQWLTRNKPRIAQTGNPSDCAAVLAEIRCYGALLEAGLAVLPVPTTSTATPDFSFEIDGQTGFVEVATKQEDSDQIQLAEQVAAGNLPEGVERSTIETAGARLEFTAMELHPFGAPNPDKPGDSTQANAISRICSIKAGERQVAEGQLALLWLDFRDLGKWPGILKVENTSPLISGRAGTLTSGPVWYAFYGWKGAPILEEDRPGIQSIGTMQHFGRFHPHRTPPSKYAAAVICLDDATVLFENPSAQVSLPLALRQKLIGLPSFDIGHTVAGWRPGDLMNSIRLSRSMIEALKAALI